MFELLYLFILSLILGLECADNPSEAELTTLRDDYISKMKTVDDTVFRTAVKDLRITYSAAIEKAKKSSEIVEKQSILSQGREALHRVYFSAVLTFQKNYHCQFVRQNAISLGWTHCMKIDVAHDTYWRILQDKLKETKGDIKQETLEEQFDLFAKEIFDRIVDKLMLLLPVCDDVPVPIIQKSQTPNMSSIKHLLTDHAKHYKDLLETYEKTLSLNPKLNKETLSKLASISSAGQEKLFGRIDSLVEEARVRCMGTDWMGAFQTGCRYNARLGCSSGADKLSEITLDIHFKMSQEVFRQDKRFDLIVENVAAPSEEAQRDIEIKLEKEISTYETVFATYFDNIFEWVKSKMEDDLQTFIKPWVDATQRAYVLFANHHARWKAARSHINKPEIDGEFSIIKKEYSNMMMKLNHAVEVFSSQPLERSDDRDKNHDILRADLKRIISAMPAYSNANNMALIYFTLYMM